MNVQKKRMLIYAHYYSPDVASTGQLVKDIAEGLGDKIDITVVCVVPSYTGKIEERYKDKKYYVNNENGIKVVRVRVPEFSKTNKVSRVKNILTYFFRAMRVTFKVGKQDYVFSISQPPILGGLLGVWGKWVKGAKYIYNIQDFNPEQTMAVGYVGNKVVLKLMMALDKFSCKCSDKVIVVGRDMEKTLEKRFVKTKAVPKHTFINNWIDENEIYPLDVDNKKVLEFKKKYNLNQKFTIMYSGNVGLYYDLENIIKVIEKFPEGTKTSDGKDVVFAFVGAGSMLDELKEYVHKNNMANVIFIPYQDKKDLVYSLNAGDVHWVVNAKNIKGVSVPSKCYGVMAAGKPVMGVLEDNSECFNIINDSQCGLCCEPGDYEAIEKQLKWFIDNASNDNLEIMGTNGREYVCKYLTKKVSVDKYRENILQV